MQPNISTLPTPVISPDQLREAIATGVLPEGIPTQPPERLRVDAHYAAVILSRAVDPVRTPDGTPVRRPLDIRCMALPAINGALAENVSTA